METVLIVVGALTIAVALWMLAKARRQRRSADPEQLGPEIESAAAEPRPASLMGAKGSEHLPTPRRRDEPTNSERLSMSSVEVIETRVIGVKGHSLSPVATTPPPPPPSATPPPARQTGSDDLSTPKTAAAGARSSSEPGSQASPSQAATTAKTPKRGEDAAALRQSLSTTRQRFFGRLAGLFAQRQSVDAELVAEIEMALIGADVGVKTSQRLLEVVRQSVQSGVVTSPERAWKAIRSEARSVLAKASEHHAAAGGPHSESRKPWVVVVVGVNGVGKTTTIGKIARHFIRQNKRILLVAADTFRAAAVLQLEAWGRRVGCEVVKGSERADPSSVVFDAIRQGIDTGVDVVVIDTAGRLHTKAPLMDELIKIQRTAEKALGGRPPDEVLLVVDATNGQNAVQQARTFCEALPVSGIVLTKLDGSAKGGVVLAIADEQLLPVRYVGIGERLEDLREFDADAFINALFTPPEPADNVVADVAAMGKHSDRPN